MNSYGLTKHYKQHKFGNVSDKWHLYLSAYDRLFFSLRELPVSILEIGVQNGGSLDIWAAYFVNATVIIGCDSNPKCAEIPFASERAHVVVGDINNFTTIQDILAFAPAFDVVIDDASHMNGDVIRTFLSLFEHVNDGGFYIVEDLHCSYWEEYGGGLFHATSSYGFFKALVDVCNVEHWGVDMQPAQYFRALGFDVTENLDCLKHIHAIEFMNSLCIIHKKDPASNVLGPRCISGDRETVCAIKHLNGEAIDVPDQRGNPKSQPVAKVSVAATPKLDPANGALAADLEKVITALRHELEKRDEIISRQNCQIQQMQIQQSQLHEELIRAEAQLALLKDDLLSEQNGIEVL